MSLLSFDKVEEFNEKGGQVKDGDFGENLLVEGMDFRTMPVGTQIFCGDVVLEITQIGEGMPQPLCHPPQGGRLYHAQGRCLCKSVKWRDHPPG